MLDRLIQKYVSIDDTIDLMSSPKESNCSFSQTTFQICLKAIKVNKNSKLKGG